MHYAKKILSSFSCAIFLTLTLIGQTFAADANKFSTAEIEKFVTDAKAFAVANGKDAAIKAFMDPSNAMFRKGSLYVFAFDSNGVCLAHIKNAMVGSNMLELKDPNGVAVIKELKDAANKDPKGGWTEYVWQNPASNTVEKKYSFAMAVDNNWWLGAGVYESEKK